MPVGTLERDETGENITFENNLKDAFPSEQNTNKNDEIAFKQNNNKNISSNL